MRSQSLLSAIGKAIGVKALHNVPSGHLRGDGWHTVHEPFAGAWQRNISVESDQNLLAFSAVYSCITLIASDIAKLPIAHVRKNRDMTWTQVFNSPRSALLRKPNRYQTWMQFMENWITSKLIFGNTYVAKERDGRGLVTALYVMQPNMVQTLVAEDGSVFYRYGQDNLMGITAASITFGANDVIHDRMNPLHHPLVGVSPIRACAASGTHGMRIQANAAKFFENMSRPSGVLEAPGVISDETAKRLKEQFQTNYSGSGLGALLVMGDGLKYSPMTIPAHDAQLIEQLRWTVEDVARCFHVPLFMIGAGEAPTFNNAQSYRLSYYQQTLQGLIESVESLLDHGLDMPIGEGVEMDVDAMLRMDAVSRADANEKAIRAGYLAPNEARLRENLPPVAGGASPYLQQQNWSLEQLANRQPPKDSPDGAKHLVTLEHVTKGMEPPSTAAKPFAGPGEYLQLLARVARLEGKQ